MIQILTRLAVHMCRFLIGAVFLLASMQAQKAQFFAPFGQAHTPKGHLHVLVVVVRYENYDAMPGYANWPNNDTLPDFLRGENNTLFSADAAQIKDIPRGHNLSDWYNTMSGGQFVVTGEVFPVQVPVRFNGITRANEHSRQSKVNRMATEWIAENYPDFDWSRFDLRTNYPRYRFDNSTTPPDSILDYVYFMHRTPGMGGIGSSGSHNVPGTPYRISMGHTSAQSSGESVKTWEHFKHELAHNIYNAPHYNGANSTDGAYYYVQRGYGMMSDVFPPFFTVNAWENWWLDWFEPQDIRTPGKYRLRDFVSSGDALRIQIPGTQNYLWLENHQLKSPWDKRPYFNEKEPWNYPDMAPGMYGYVVAGPGGDRNRASLQVFNNQHCNIIRYINGDGNHDYIPTGERFQTQYVNAYVSERVADNPFAGMNDWQFLRWDYNNDGVINVGLIHGNVGPRQGESEAIWVTKIKGKPVPTYNVMGDTLVAYKPGQSLGLSGVQPVINYPLYNLKEQRLDPFLINGIRVTVLPAPEPGVIEVEVVFDDWEIRSDKRWCGRLILPNQPNNRYLDIAEKVTLTLDLSGTCDRVKPHPETGTFANPTSLTVEGGRGIRLAKGSSLRVARFSSLTLQGNSQIIVEKGAKLIVESAGKLIMEDESQVIVKRGGKLIIESDGYLRTSPNAKIPFMNTRRVLIKGNRGG